MSERPIPLLFLLAALGTGCLGGYEAQTVRFDRDVELAIEIAGDELCATQTRYPCDGPQVELERGARTQMSLTLPPFDVDLLATDPELAHYFGRLESVSVESGFTLEDNEAGVHEEHVTITLARLPRAGTAVTDEPLRDLVERDLGFRALVSVDVPRDRPGFSERRQPFPPKGTVRLTLRYQLSLLADPTGLFEDP